MVNNCVEVTLNPQLVMAVRKRSDRNKSDSTNQVSSTTEYFILFKILKNVKSEIIAAIILIMLCENRDVVRGLINK